MKYFRLTKGLTLPIEGPPAQTIADEKPVGRVAVVGPDYVGMKPRLIAQVGDRVRVGQPLFEDKKVPGVMFTSAAAGTVAEINRGDKRAFLSMVIDVDGDEGVEFPTHAPAALADIDGETVRQRLIESGLWAAFRTRPFSRSPMPDSTPHALFVTAIDTHPLAPRADLVIAEARDDFENGLRVLSAIAGKCIYLCTAPDVDIPGGELPYVEQAAFDGPHPAGLPGTHIHMLEPVGRQKTVWHIGYQDVIAIGRLFTTGRIDTERVVALSGSSVKNPRLVRTRLGASLDELLAGELVDGENRVVSGSVLGGRECEGALSYLGRFHNQVTVLPEYVRRELFGWIMPGIFKYSLTRTVASRFLPPRRMKFDTSQNGGHRAIFPTDSFEKVMPLDIMPLYLFRSLAIQDVEEAERLGCLELDEEDLALCTYACPGKNDYGVLLRDNLTIIEKEG